jgi:hypothetical protein
VPYTYHNNDIISQIKIKSDVSEIIVANVSNATDIIDKYNYGA